jgi:hypothetical protein
MALALPWHFLYFLPLPQGQGSLRPTLGSSGGRAGLAVAAVAGAAGGGLLSLLHAAARFDGLAGGAALGGGGDLGRGLVLAADLHVGTASADVALDG